MRRRALLAGLSGVAAALAGCGGAGQTTPERTGTPTPTPRPPAELRWNAEPLSAATDDEPARVQVTVRNVGGPGDLTFEGRLPLPPTPGDPTFDDFDHPRPVLLPVEADADRERDPGCWKAPIDDPAMADDEPWAWGYGDERTVRLTAGEPRAATYHVVNSWLGECFPAGTYRFDRAYELDGEFRKPGLALDLPLDPAG